MLNLNDFDCSLGAADELWMIVEANKEDKNMKKTILFVTAICVGLVAMISARAAEKAGNPSSWR